MAKKNVIYVFIDASNLWEAQKAKGKFFDYEKLKNFIKEKFNGSSIEVFLLLRLSRRWHERL